MCCFSSLVHFLETFNGPSSLSSPLYTTQGGSATRIFPLHPPYPIRNFIYSTYVCKGMKVKSLLAVFMLFSFDLPLSRFPSPLLFYLFTLDSIVIVSSLTHFLFYIQWICMLISQFSLPFMYILPSIIPLPCNVLLVLRINVRVTGRARHRQHGSAKSVAHQQV